MIILLPSWLIFKLVDDRTRHDTLQAALCHPISYHSNLNLAILLLLRAFFNFLPLYFFVMATLLIFFVLLLHDFLFYPSPPPILIFLLIQLLPNNLLFLNPTTHTPNYTHYLIFLSFINNLYILSSRDLSFVWGFSRTTK